MEFNFNINNYFKEEITKIGSRLIPDGFIGDRREIQDCVSKVSYVLTILGEKSAKAQGLQKVITSGEKLRNSDHVVYVLIDPKGGSKNFGTVLGMLKIGVKHLYVFDAGGNSHEITTKCILDFYVHESKQRMGLGKKLFQYMLKEERVDPVHLAIDKPSSKFLSFLHKYYNLEVIIPQMNNFVVFEGFFSNRTFGGTNDKDQMLPSSINSCGSRLTSGPSKHGISPSSSSSYHHRQSSSAVNLNNASYYGRQVPHKPISTMGMILQQKPAPSQQPSQNGRAIVKDNSNFFRIPEKAEEILEENGEGKPSVLAFPSSSSSDSVAQPATITVEDDKIHNNVSVSSPTSQNSDVEGPKMSPKPVQETKSRLNGQGHLDLKFYHSSLW